LSRTSGSSASTSSSSNTFDFRDLRFVSFFGPFSGSVSLDFLLDFDFVFDVGDDLEEMLFSSFTLSFSSVTFALSRFFYF